VLSPFLFSLYLDDLGKLIDPANGCYGILYADDILLLFPSVTYLERLLHLCENELAWLDMAINFKMSGCLRVGTRYDRECTTIRPISSDGRNLTCCGVNASLTLGGRPSLSLLPSHPLPSPPHLNPPLPPHLSP